MKHELPVHWISHGSRPASGVYLRVTFGRSDPSTGPAAPPFAHVQAASEAFAAAMHATYVVHVGRATPGMRVDFEMAESVDEAAAIACLDRLASERRLIVLSSERHVRVD